MAFVKGFGVIGLAIGVVMGGAVTNLVTSLVSNIITPIIGAIAGEVNFASLSFTLGKSKIMHGAFIGSLIDFLIIILIIYIAVKAIVGRMLTKDKREKLGL